MVSDAPVTVQRLGQVLLIELDRPQARNALTYEMAEAMADAVDLLENDASLEVGVLHGRGGYFCSGMDLRAFSETGRLAEIPGRGFGGITEAPPTKLLIAAVEGFALAGGCELVMACDLVVAAEDAVFGVPEVTRGLVPAQGGLNRLMRLVPRRVALELVVTGRRFSAAEALTCGFVNRVAVSGEALAGALALAEQISANGPLAVRTAKSVMTLAADLTLAESWAAQAVAVQAVLDSDDAREGAAAFVEKREPRWPSRAAA